jgi:hypothetical protein
VVVRLSEALWNSLSAMAAICNGGSGVSVSLNTNRTIESAREQQ